MTDLARELGKLGAWVRLHYVYPYPHVDHVIPLMAEGLVLPYLDIPFQHASPSVLRAMKRPANQVKVLERLRVWRDICPDIAIRSSFVVGFPGETEADFEYLLEWLDEGAARPRRRLPLRAGCGRRRERPSGRGPEAVKEERYARIMERTAAISAAKLQAEDRPRDRRDHRRRRRRRRRHRPLQGRRAGDRRRGPPARRGNLRQGDFARVLIEDADEHDLFGCRRVANLPRYGGFPDPAEIQIIAAAAESSPGGSCQISSAGPLGQQQVRSEIVWIYFSGD
jgi:ribosomal protein S12 methylthiotransferase